MEKKDLCDKYNLMEISISKLDQIDRDKVGPGCHVALLYGMPVILNKIGKNTNFIQDTVANLSKFNHPSLALNYGFMIEKQEGQNEDDFSENDSTYIVRELVKGKNFHNINSFHYHDKLVLLYKLICLLEFLHSFDIYYIFVHPSKIIITDDLEVKLVDHIKINEDKLNSIKSQPLNDEARFIFPELFYKDDLRLDKAENKKLLQIDLYSFGAVFFYAITGELPWASFESKEEIIQNYKNSVSPCVISTESSYNDDFKNVSELILGLLTFKFDNTEKVRSAFEKLPEVQEYLKNGTLKFDFESECKKVVDNINQLVQEIEKLFDDNNLPRHFNTIHQSRLKFSDNNKIDTTKATKSKTIHITKK